MIRRIVERMVCSEALADAARRTRHSFPAPSGAPVRLLAAMLVVGVLVSCSDDGENWSYVGLRQVWVDTIVAPDTISTTDTLTVILDGTVPGYGNAYFSHVETARDSFEVDFTVWADCYNWSGSGPMPPLPIWVRCEPDVPPPFPPGPLLLVARRPDSSTVSDTILVVP